MDKPAGVTSHDVVAIVRRRLGIDAVGHTGTLDPFATGLLLLLLGGATRLGRFAAGDPKRYRATARLGFGTTTDDLTGEPLGPAWDGEWPPRDRVESTLTEMVGAVDQRPPAFSAKKVGGVRSYRLARRLGPAAVALDPVLVRIDHLGLVDYAPPRVEFTAQVGPGVYLRSVARDLGERLGTGAHLTALRREGVGPFGVEAAVPLERVDANSPRLSPLELLGPMPRVTVSSDDAAALRCGRSIGTAVDDQPTSVLVLGAEVVAIGRPRGGHWQPTVVLGGQ